MKSTALMSAGEDFPSLRSAFLRRVSNNIRLEDKFDSKATATNKKLDERSEDDASSFYHFYYEKFSIRFASEKGKVRKCPHRIHFN